MIAATVGGVRGWLVELLQVALAGATLWFLVAALDVALHERLINGGDRASVGAIACVISPPLTERVRAGQVEAEVPVVSEQQAQPARRGELAASLARVGVGGGGSHVTGVREDGVFYLPVEKIASLAGAELRHASAGAPARLISEAGLIEIVPMSSTAWRNFRPVELAHAPQIIDQQLQVPVRGIDQLLPISTTWDEQKRSWKLASGDRELWASVPEDLFEIVIVRSTRTLTVNYGGQHLVTWSCCVGPGNKSPAGSWEIRNKAVWPPWTSYEGEYIPGGSGRNPLGARWLGTSARGAKTGRSIGIHGTNQPSSIGRRISGGCIRLLNHQAIEMYDTIPIGTRVIIKE